MEKLVENIYLEESPVPLPPLSIVPDQTISKQPERNGTLIQQFSNFPHELEELAKASTIAFKQVVQIVQMVCGCNMPINFDLINENDQIIYQVREEEDFCARNCIPQGLRTNFSMVKTNGLHALQFRREKRCVLRCCLPCCCYPLLCSKERLTVSSAIGELYGTVRYDWSAWRPRFSILNIEDNVVMKIEGPGCYISFGSDLHYTIVTLDGVVIGSIIKHWNGYIAEVFTDFDNFTINFPRDLDIRLKATLIGAVLLINFLLFQGQREY